MAAFVFYNPLAGDGRLQEDLDVLEFVLDEDTGFCDITKPETYEEMLLHMEQEDIFILCGGDGTLHRFVNQTGELQRSNEIYYYPAGEHNDFARDYGRRYGCNPFAVTQKLRFLPQVRIGGRTHFFLTGLVLESADEIRRTFPRKLGYTGGKSVTVTVDGELKQFENVRFAALMYGRHCAGGLIPDQDRRRGDEMLSCVLIHGCRKWRIRYLLHRLRKGKVPNARFYSVLRGSEIRLLLDSPADLRCDGELLTGVTDISAAMPPKG